MVLADLSVRKLDEETYERLRSRASKHGVSMEEEVRRILKKKPIYTGKHQFHIYETLRP